jgi:hypothetical protein
MPDPNMGPYPLSHVLCDELEALRGGRRPTPQALVTLRLGLPADQDDRGDDLLRRRAVYRAAYDLDLSALCLSGGGIRSASFALGVIQGLAEAKLLQKFDYLSTVSGGGYIGSWLSAWLRRNGNADEVTRQLLPQRALSDEEPEPIRHLREYSAYLTPKLGLLSGDFWAAIAIIVRNLLLMWLILLPLIALPVIAVKLIAALTQTAPAAPGLIAILVWLLCLGLGGWSFRYKIRRLYLVRPAVIPAREQPAFLKGSLLPAMAAGFCFAWISGALAAHWADRVAAGFYWDRWLMIVATALLVYVAVEASLSKAARGILRDWLGWAGGAIVWGTLIWLGMRLYTELPLDGEIVQIGTLCVKEVTGCVTNTVPHSFGIDRRLVLVILGMPWFLLSIMFAQTAYTLARSYSPAGDFEREWLGRAGGWYLLGGLGWIVLSSVVLLGPKLYSSGDFLMANGKNWLTAIGAASGAVTAILGKNSLTPAKGITTGWTGIAANVVLAVVGPLFAVVLLILLSVAFDWVALGHTFEDSALFKFDFGSPDYRANWVWSVGVVAVLGAVTLICGFLANVNRFSLHAVYRNRLTRAYLGASRGPQRKPDGFTGFDQNDNMPVKDLWPATVPSGPDWRPFHVINMALNLAGTRNLAWQQRKAMSFTATPRFCGAADLGYRGTSQYGNPGDGISLGTAMAISGAAVSPNMGYHSSPSIAFLLTLFNVRLGWWLGNPGKAGDALSKGQIWRKQLLLRLTRQPDRPLAPYTQDAPWFAIRPLLSELFGMTDEDSAYVYLSDGGHFENLGLYEMVRRRCKWIIVIDADADAERGFGDLGDAVRKIWIDLGIHIRFPEADLLQAPGDAKPADVPYFALGTAEYVSDRDPPPTGNILYIKPGVRGDEGAADIIAYQRQNRQFPHQSTGDQWFDEPQLEAYRALGYLIVKRIVDAAKPPPADLAALFSRLAAIDPKTLGPRVREEDT